MNEPLKVEGIIEDIGMKPVPTEQNPNGMRYAFKIKGRNYATFDSAIGEEFKKFKNKKVLVEYYDKTTGNITYHNILKMTLDANFESGDALPPVMEEDVIDKEDVWYKKERKQYRGMCCSYAKDLVVADKIKKEELLDIAEKMFSWIMEE